MILLKPATLPKVALLHGCFSRFLNCTNGTKSRKASQISYDKKKFSGAGNLQSFKVWCPLKGQTYFSTKLHLFASGLFKYA